MSSWPADRIYVHDPLYQFHDDYPPAGPDLPPGSLAVLDEADLLMGPNYYVEDWLRDYVHYYRHYGVSLILCARRPVNVHRDVTSQASVVYLGSMREPRDIEYLVRAWGERCRRVVKLQPRQFLKIYP